MRVWRQSTLRKTFVDMLFRELLQNFIAFGD